MIGGQRFDYVGTKHAEEPARGDVGLNEERRRRLALLLSMLGADGPRTALKSARMTRDEMIGILANGLGITEQEVLDLLMALLGIGDGPEEPQAALKARQEAEEPHRDHQGRRINKPYGLKREEEDGGPRRDRQGYRRNKPFRLRDEER